MRDLQLQARHRRRRHRSSALSRESLDDRLGDRFGVFVAHEVAAIENSAPRPHERIVSFPDDERFSAPGPSDRRSIPGSLDMRRDVHQQPRHEGPLLCNRECIGVDGQLCGLRTSGRRAPVWCRKMSRPTVANCSDPEARTSAVLKSISLFPLNPRPTVRASASGGPGASLQISSCDPWAAV